MAVVSLPKTMAYIHNLKNAEGALLTAASVATGELKKNWLSGLGANDRPTKALSMPYAIAKAKSGRDMLPNMSYRGDLHSSISPRMKNQYTAVVGPDQSGHYSGMTAKQLMRVQVGWRPELFQTSRRFVSLIKKEIVKYFKAHT